MADTPTTNENGKPKRKRISVYNAKIMFKIYDMADNPQACVDARKKIEAFAKENGAIEIDGVGFFNSTMIDVLK